MSREIQPKPLFESEVCSRCCGTGHYSFNLISGTRCFGCGGVGHKLTKRGQAAQTYLNELRQAKVSELKVGDLIRFDLHTVFCFERITAIEPSENNDGRITISAIRTKTQQPIGFVTYLTASVTRGFTNDEKIALREQALAYQATLTKQGVPSKRGNKKTA